MSKGYRAAFPVDSRSSGNLAGRPAFFTSPPTGFPGLDFAAMSWQDCLLLLRRLLEEKIHGIAYSPYVDGQSPGTEVSPQQIAARLDIIKEHTRWIRTFSCIEGNQETPRIAHENGLQTMVGVGLGEDREENEIELENGIAIARAGHADILAVGNEVLLRGDLSEDELLQHIERAKKAAPGVPVGYVDAYFLFEKHPRLVDACDLLLINCYPFWEHCPFEYSLYHMQEMYRRTERIAQGKKIIISETGWPSTGTPYGGAVPGLENALKYFLNAYQWAEDEGIDIFYFSSFDESWKTGDEGDVGAYWGLWDKDGYLKYG